MTYLIDTDILVDYIRKNPKATEYLNSVGAWSYSVVTAMELYMGARNNNEVAALDKFLSLFQEIPLSEESGARGRDILRTYIRNQTGLDPLDALIAASAISGNFRLATKNKKHFRNIEGLDVEVPEYN